MILKTLIHYVLAIAMLYFANILASLYFMRRPFFVLEHRYTWLSEIYMILVTYKHCLQRSSEVFIPEIQLTLEEF